MLATTALRMINLEEHFTRAEARERFAMLVSARVNQILSGGAKEFVPNGKFTPPEQEALLFADLVARAVCAHLPTGEEK